MSKKAVVWIRDDFRIKNNSALSYATNNYDTVTALYIYNKENFDDIRDCLLYTSPSPRDPKTSRMPSSA